jgi:hypothetical protein
MPGGQSECVPRPALWLSALAIVFCLTLSDQVLLFLGFHYATPGGHPTIKIHPATWLILAAFVMVAWRRAASASLLAAWLAERGALIAAAASVVLVFAYKVVSSGVSDSAFLIDTFLAPALFVLVIIDSPHAFRRRMVDLIIVLLLLNALIAIGEAATQTRLVPFYISGKLAKDEGFFRATALNGYPLRNALLTACGLIALVAVQWPVVVRLGCALVLVLGLLAFGGRAAIAIGLAGALLVAAIKLRPMLRRGGAALGLAVWAVLVFGTITAAGAAAVISQTDIGGRIVNGGFGDASMMARADLTGLVDYVDFDDLLPGYSPDAIQQLMTASHLPNIECFWVNMLLYLGLVGFLVWLFGFVGELLFLCRHTDSAGRTIIACVLLVASTSVSLSSKDTILNIAFTLMMGTGLARMPRVATG